MNQLLTHSSPSSAVFDTPTYIEFVYAFSIPSTITFPHYTSLNSNITFNQLGYANIPSNIVFKVKTDLPSSITFIQFGEESLPSSITFKKKFDINSSITFTKTVSFDLPSYIFLGLFKVFLPSSITFNQANYKDFRAQIQILQSTVQGTNLQNSASTTIPSSIYFNAKTSVDISSSISFTQFGHNNFPATITIRNPALGGGNIDVILQNATTQITGSSIYVPLYTVPPIDGDAIIVQTDATGYFSIDGLQPGTYTIIPQYPTLAFSPPAYDVLITDSNISLSFLVGGELINDVATGSSVPTPSPGVCLTTASSNVAGFSIDGYIGLQLAYEQYNEVITVITDENIASAFRDIISSSADIED